jgi:sRNA-binding protein
MDFRGDNCHTLAQKHAKLANRQERRQQRRDNRHRYERLREAHKANKLFLKAIVDIIGTEFRSDEQKCKDIELLLITEGFWDGVKKLTLSLD